MPTLPVCSSVWAGTVVYSKFSPLLNQHIWLGLWFLTLGLNWRLHWLLFVHLWYNYFSFEIIRPPDQLPELHLTETSASTGVVRRISPCSLSISFVSQGDLFHCDKHIQPLLSLSLLLITFGNAELWGFQKWSERDYALETTFCSSWHASCLSFEYKDEWKEPQWKQRISYIVSVHGTHIYYLILACIGCFFSHLSQNLKPLCVAFEHFGDSQW